jgi:type IV secretory pathway TrbD component
VIRTLPEWAQAALTLVALLWMASFGAPLWAYALPVLIFLLTASVERN